MLSPEQLAAALAAVRDRERTGLAALARERRDDVVRWQATRFDYSVPRPEPWASERQGFEDADEPPVPDDDGRWLSQQVGFDADGRPVLVRQETFGERHVTEAWVRGDGWIDVVEAETVSRYLLDGDGRVVATVAVEHGPHVEQWEWEGGVARRGTGAWLGSDHVSRFAYDAELDADGRLVTLRRTHASGPREHADEIEGLLDGLRRAAELTPADVHFDARLHRREPRLRESAALVELLVPEIERAVVDAVASCGVPRPFAVELRLAHDHVVPEVRVGGEAFRDHVRATVPDRHAALKLLADATPPDGATVSLLDGLSDAALRACRELDWAIGRSEQVRRRGFLDRTADATAGDGVRGRASAALEALGAELSARLNARDWPGVADPFLVLVHIGALDAPVRPFVRAAQTVGKEHVQAFRRSLAAQPREPVEPPPPDSLDRDALERWLAASGLRRDAARIAHEVAQVGMLVVDAGGRAARSRLGGPGLLAPGAAWPHAEGERPHTFMAGIALDELPSNELLPDAGWLLFHADIDDPEGEAAGLVDFSDNAPGAQIHVAYLPPGVEPVEAAPPSSLSTVLERRPVAFAPRLTLPTGYGAGEELGLGLAERTLYDDLAERFGEGYGHHWVLGHETGVQGHPPEEGTVLLLHLADDYRLGFEYLDAGAIQFRIPARALAAGDWSAVVAHADSG